MIYKGKNDKLDFKKIFSLKYLVKMMKRQPTDWGKIFANCISDNRLVSGTYIIGKWPKDMSRLFTERIDIQMENKHIKKKKSCGASGWRRWLESCDPNTEVAGSIPT